MSLPIWTTSRPLTASGEAAVPQKSLLVSIDWEKSFVHNCLPVAVSQALRMPVTPSVKRRFADHEWRGVRTLRHLDRVLVLLESRLVLLFPNDFAVGEIDRGDDLLGIAPSVNEDAAAGNYRRRVALADLDAPRALQLVRPRGRRVLLRDEPIAPRPAPLRPVLRPRGRRHAQQEKQNPGCQLWVPHATAIIPSTDCAEQVYAGFRRLFR